MGCERGAGMDTLPNRGFCLQFADSKVKRQLSGTAQSVYLPFFEECDTLPQLLGAALLNLVVLKVLVGLAETKGNSLDHEDLIRRRGV